MPTSQLVDDLLPMPIPCEQIHVRVSQLLSMKSLPLELRSTFLNGASNNGSINRSAVLSGKKRSSSIVIILRSIGGLLALFWAVIVLYHVRQLA